MKVNLPQLCMNRGNKMRMRNFVMVLVQEYKREVGNGKENKVNCAFAINHHSVNWLEKFIVIQNITFVRVHVFFSSSTKKM